MQTLKGFSVATIDNFISANNGECIDAVEGSLIDNAVYAFDFGTLFCFEQYLNEWDSGYICYFFSKYHPRGINKMWDRFNALKTEDA